MCKLNKIICLPVIDDCFDCTYIIIHKQKSINRCNRGGERKLSAKRVSKSYLIPNFGKSLQLCLTDILNSLTFTEHVAGSCRFTAYYGNTPYNYSYSYHPAANLPENLSIRKCLDCINEFFSDAGLNSVLINYYPCGASKLNFHSDDEIKIDDESFIFTLSYGHRRTMAFRSLNHRKHLINVTLTDCSLLLFSKASQHIYQHSILPETGATGRVSLTFRKLIEGDSRYIPI